MKKAINKLLLNKHLHYGIPALVWGFAIAFLQLDPRLFWISVGLIAMTMISAVYSVFTKQ